MIVPKWISELDFHLFPLMPYYLKIWYLDIFVKSHSLIWATNLSPKSYLGYICLSQLFFISPCLLLASPCIYESCLLLWTFLTLTNTQSHPSTQFIANWTTFILVFWPWISISSALSCYSRIPTSPALLCCKRSQVRQRPGVTATFQGLLVWYLHSFDAYVLGRH